MMLSVCAFMHLLKLFYQVRGKGKVGKFCLYQALCVILKNMIRLPGTNPIRALLSYLMLIFACQTVVLSLITFAVSQYTTLNADRFFQKIAVFFQANQVLTNGIASAIFLFFFRSDFFRELLYCIQRKNSFLKPVVQGFFIGALYLGITLLTGHESILGIYLKWKEFLFSSLSSLIFTFAFLASISADEWIFRKKIDPFLRTRMQPAIALGCSSFLYATLKIFQFKANTLFFFNMFILNLLLHAISKKERSFVSSALFHSCFFFFIHILFGFPFCSFEFPSLFLVSGNDFGPEGEFTFTLFFFIFFILTHFYDLGAKHDENFQPSTVE